MILSLSTGSAAHEFACHSSSCRPPTSGGTGGSTKGGGGGGGAAPRPSGSGGSFAKWAGPTSHKAGPIRDAHGFPFKDQAAAAKLGLKPSTAAPHPNDRGAPKISNGSFKKWADANPMKALDHLVERTPRPGIAKDGSKAVAKSITPLGTAKGGGTATLAVKRLKPGQRRTIKDENGTTIGTVSRNSKGQHFFNTANSYAGGTARNLEEGIAHLNAHAAKDRVFGASVTRPQNRTPEQKATLKADTHARTGGHSAGHALNYFDSTGIAKVRAAYGQVQGKVKASHVVVGRAENGGYVKVQGKNVDIKVTKVQGGYSVDNRYKVKTMAAARNVIAREINDVNGS